MADADGLHTSERTRVQVISHRFKGFKILKNPPPHFPLINWPPDRLKPLLIN